ADADDRRVLPLRPARRLRHRRRAGRGGLPARDGRRPRLRAPADRVSAGRLLARAAAPALAGFVIVGPLTSLAVWSLAERWTYPSPWPQRFGLRYWQRVVSGDFLEPLRLGVIIAVLVTALALAMAIPLGYALARLTFRGRTLILLLFLLPQAFPQL